MSVATLSGGPWDVTHWIIIFVIAANVNHSTSCFTRCCLVIPPHEAVVHGFTLGVQNTRQGYQDKLQQSSSSSCFKSVPPQFKFFIFLHFVFFGSPFSSLHLFFLVFHISLIPQHTTCLNCDVVACDTVLSCRQRPRPRFRRKLLPTSSGSGISSVI